MRLVHLEVGQVSRDGGERALPHRKEAERKERGPEQPQADHAETRSEAAVASTSGKVRAGFTGRELRGGKGVKLALSEGGDW